MRYFPVLLAIKDKPCVVVGGGNVADRKVKSLLACGASVTVISPDLTKSLIALKDAKQIKWVSRAYEAGDLAGAFLVIAATDDTSVQDRIFQEAEEGHILLNVADVPERCNFILPATVRRGDLSISISTGGKSPALAKKTRQELERQFGDEYELLLNILGTIRSAVLSQNLEQAENERLFSHLLHPDMISWLHDQKWDMLLNHIESTLGGRITPELIAGIRDDFCTPSPRAGTTR